MENILGYNVNKCPVCGHPGICEVEDHALCPTCGDIPGNVFLAGLLRLPLQMAQNIFESGAYGLPFDLIGRESANYDGNVVNFITDEKPYRRYPTLWGEMGGTGDIIILDRILPEVFSVPNVLAFTEGWVGQWGDLFQGRRVFLLGNSRKSLRAILANLKNANEVFMGPLTGDDVFTSKANAESAISPGEVITRSKPSLEGKDLSDLIDSFHYVPGPKGAAYQQTLNIPVHRVVSSVIEWFQENGARFLWDTEESKGYMFYDGRLFLLNSSDCLLKSLLRKQGGITTATLEGRAIVDGLCSMALDSEHIAPSPWLTMDVKKREICLHQAGNDIVISPGKVEAVRKDGFSYDLIVGDKKWFSPVNLVEGDGLHLLFDLVASYFAVPETAKEIIICWLLGIFLKDYSSIRPGIRLCGPASTGKSTTLQIIYWLFYGRNEAELPTFPSVAGLWRVGSVEPLLPLDNKNVDGLDDSIRTFLDVCATGGKRIMGVSGGAALETRTQKAHSLVIISGLDVFLHHDVRTRYIEIETDANFKSDYYAHEDRQRILESRDLIMSSVFRLIAEDVLLSIGNFTNREASQKYKILLDSKERVVDYFLIMLAIGNALQKRGVIAEGDLAKRWSDYIRDKSTETDIANATTVEWWNNFKIAFVRDIDDLQELTVEGIKMNVPWKLLEKGGKRIGITGTPEELMSALSWAARRLNRVLPWKKAVDMKKEYLQDEKAWTAKGWEYIEDDNNITVKWGDGI